jgi:diguanylate cyclase (GGDEF)-like protein
LKIEYKKPEEAESDQALYKAANIDDLTNILNRGAFMAKAQKELELSKRNKSNLSMALCDADHFKLKNDAYGHLAGDHILKELAAIITAHLRKNDILGRYGGEEFIILLREISENEALAWGERIRLAISRHPFEVQGQPIPTTMSIGICCSSIKQTDSLSAIIKIADDALYTAKRNGRNQVVLV